MTDSQRHTPEVSQNRILAALPGSAYERLYSKMQLVTLKSRQVLHTPNSPLDYVYFLEKGLVSLAIGFVDGFQAEVGLVGHEGLVGLSAVHGIEAEITEAVVQVPGAALRMKASLFRQELETQPALMTKLLRYSNMMRTRAMQTAACNGHHSLDRRLARWLLMVYDLTRATMLPITQEALAGMLSVHRPSVTVAAGRLQRAGLIRHAAGTLAILDPSGLERVSCECYRIVREACETVHDTA